MKRKEEVTQRVFKTSNGDIALQDLLRVFTRSNPKRDLAYYLFMYPGTRNGVPIWNVWQEYGPGCTDPTLEFGNEGDAFSTFLHLASTWDAYDEDIFGKLVRHRRKALTRKRNRDAT